MENILKKIYVQRAYKLQKSKMKRDHRTPAYFIQKKIVEYLICILLVFVRSVDDFITNVLVFMYT